MLKTELGEIEYNSVGKGIPVLFVHGGHSNCNEILSHKGFDLNRFHLITPSRPGYGQTPLNNNRTPKQAADLLIKLIDHLSLNTITVYGISAGGLTAIALASNYPDRVSKLVLASSISKKWLDKKEKTYRTAKIIFNPKMEKFTWGAVRFFSRVFPNMIASSFYPQFSSYTKSKLKENDTKELISAMRSYRSKSGFLNDIDQTIDNHTLSQINCPTLIIHSEHDNSVPFEHALNSHKMIKNSVIISLKNEWGHLFWIGSDSGESIKKIVNFIDQTND